MISLSPLTFFSSNLDFDNLMFLQKELNVSLLNLKNKEKRRRNFTNFILERIFSQSTFFDFFSKDTIEILLIAKKIAQILKKKEVTEDIIFLSLFMTPQSDIASFFLKQNISFKNIISLYLNDIEYVNFPKKILLNFEKELLKLKKSSSLKNFFAQKSDRLLMIPRKILKFAKKKILCFLKNIDPAKKNFGFFCLIYKLFFFKRSLKSITFSSKSLLFFDDLMVCAKKKYKTPVISIDLLSLFLLNSQIVKKRIAPYSNSLEFYMLKYVFAKKLHMQEAYIKDEIFNNQRYFAYLLKTVISRNDFEKFLKKKELLEKGDLKLKTLAIRDFLVKKFVTHHIFKILENEIFKSVSISSKDRAYQF